MRAAAVILIACCTGSTIAAPSYLSQSDLASISAAVHAVTSEPIISVNPVYESKSVPGSIPHKTSAIDLREPGPAQIRQIVIYERTDRVAVRTGFPNNMKGGSYKVERRDAGWKVIAKAVWSAEKET